MATTKSESAANIEKLLGLGMTQEQLNAEKYNGKMSGGEMQKYITKYGLSQPSDLAMAVNGDQVADQASASTATGVPTRATATDVLSQFGGSSDLNNLVAPTFDYEKAYQDLLASNGVAPLETQLNQLKTDEQTQYDQFMTNKRAEEGKIVAMNVIEGRVGEQAKNTQNKLDTITREKGSISDELNTKYNTINQLMQFKGMNFQTAKELYGEMKQTHDQLVNLQLQYPGAKIQITDDTDTIAEKIQKYNEKETIKSLYMSTFGSTGKGMSTKAMEKKLKKKYKNEKEYEKTKQKLELEGLGLDIEGKKVSIAKAKRGGGATKAEIKEATRKEGIRGFQAGFSNIAGSDGYVNPKDWKSARGQWVANGFSGKEFDDIFNQYKNPDDEGYK